MPKNITASQLCQYYDDILDNILQEKRDFKKYLASDEDEPDCNEICLKNINVTINTIQHMIHKIILIEFCLEYELNDYKQRTESLSDEEKIDKTIVNSTHWQLFNIAKSFIRTNKFLKSLQIQFQTHRFNAESYIQAAVAHDCKLQIKRTKDFSKNVLPEYILKSMFRPYYIQLCNKNISILTELSQYIDINASYQFEDHKAALQPYIEKIAEVAATKSVQNWKTTRLEDWQTSSQAAEKNKQTKEDEKQKKYIEKAKERLTKFCTEKEKTMYKKRQKGQNGTFPSKYINDPNYSIDCKNIFVIVALTKPPKGNSQFQYLTTKGLSHKMSDIDKFFFEDIPTQAIDDCYKLPNVVAVDTIRIQ